MDQDNNEEPKSIEVNDESDKNETQPAGPVPEQTSEPKSKRSLRFGSKKLWLFIVPLLLLAAGLLAMTYLYQQKATRVNELNREISTLQQAVADKDAQLAELQGESGEETTAADACSAGANYTADVGNFTLALDAPRVIIRNLDGAFEGGPATVLDIATCLEDEDNVYDLPATAEVTITANPNATSENLRTSYESNNGPLTANGTIEIAGVTANKYTLDALFNTTVIYFDNEGIGYQIELSDTNDTTNAILDDLVDDWEFES